MLRSEKFNQALEISFSFGGFSMKRDSFGRTPTFFLADSSVSSGVLFGFGQHGSWGWDPACQDFVPGFEEVGWFGVGCSADPGHGGGDAGQTLMRSRKIVSRKVQKVGSEEIPGVDVGFGADFQRQIGGIWVALLEKWRKELGNHGLMVGFG